jgi:hypothetical protein
MQFRYIVSWLVAGCFMLAVFGCGDKSTGTGTPQPLDVFAIYTDTATTASFTNGFHLWVWSGTGTFQSTPSENKHGAHTLDFIVGTQGWAGFGFHANGTDTSTGVNISAYTKMHFLIKGTASSVSACLSSVGLAGNAPALNLSAYGYAVDGNWHEINIPLADWATVDLTKVNLYAGFVASATAGGEELLFDDIWYAK